jgi:uncharacterized protein YbaR (Trm112 family)
MPQVAPDLVEILVCPETKQTVRLATAAELSSVNEKVRAGTLRSRGGEAVKSELVEALIRADGKILYPVDDGIPVMLVEDSVEL